jgi:hypothetical protein
MMPDTLYEVKDYQKVISLINYTTRVDSVASVDFVKLIHYYLSKIKCKILNTSIA